MLTKLTSDSRMSQLLQQAAVQLKRVSLSWWQVIVVVLLLLVFANSVAKLVWALLPGQNTETVKPSIDLQAGALGSTAATGVSIDKLLQLNLFGVAGAQAISVSAAVGLPEEDEIEAEDTKLSLKLTGVLSSNDASSAQAIIAHNNKQKSYKVGEKLPAGRQVTLDRVLERRVILNNAGRYESLWLFEGMEGDSLLVEIPAQNTDTGTAVTAGAAVAHHSQTNGGNSASSTVSQTVKQIVEQLPTPESLAEVIRVTPHKKGIAVKPLKNLAQFEQLGLKPGDIITAVNGTPVSLDQDQLRQLYLEVLQSSSASFQVERNGKTQNIEIDLARLAQTVSQ